MKLYDLKLELMEKANIKRNTKEEKKLEDFLLKSVWSVEGTGLSENINNFDLTADGEKNLKTLCYYEFDIEKVKMEDKIKMIKKSISKLENEENRKEFKKELQEANNPEYGPTIVYYNLVNNKICCEAITQGTIISNSVYLGKINQDVDLNDIYEDINYMIVENLIDDLDVFTNWEFYNEKGEKTIL